MFESQKKNNETQQILNDIVPDNISYIKIQLQEYFDQVFCLLRDSVWEENIYFFVTAMS